MKKILTILAVLLIAAVSHAQKIHYRVIQGDDIIMRTDYFVLKETNQKLLEMALMYERREGMEKYSLLIGFVEKDKRITVPFGSKLKMKTSQGYVIDAIQEAEDIIKEYSPETGRSTIPTSRHGYVSVGYLIISKYAISHEDLLKLANEGLSKIRIQTSHDNIDCEYSNNDWFKEWYAVLYENIDPYTTF